MFVYCLNNSVVYVDESGNSAWLIVGIILGCTAIVGLDHTLAANQPKDGYAAVNVKNEKDVVTKGLYAKGNGFEIDRNGVTLCDTDVGLVSLSFENKYGRVEFLDCLTASATAALDWSGEPSIDVSVVASIYSPAIEVVLPLGFMDLTISGEAYIGGVGVGAELDSETGRIKITPPFVGVGGTWSLDLDLH